MSLPKEIEEQLRDNMKRFPWRLSQAEQECLREIDDLRSALDKTNELFLASEVARAAAIDALDLLIGNTRLALIPDPEAEANVQKAMSIRDSQLPSGVNDVLFQAWRFIANPEIRNSQAAALDLIGKIEALYDRR